MSIIVSEETHEVTVRRIEAPNGDTEFEVLYGRTIRRRDRNALVRLPTPDREPLIELAYKGRFNALKEL